MEFLRFGSSIPGGYWGCCACCIIQNFNVDPDAKASIQLVSGDGGNGIQGPGGKMLFAGPTYRDIFFQRIRSGTFDKRDMPNHAFLAIITQDQLGSSNGKKWLAILKETGFEFIRTVSNSVYGGQSLAKPSGKGAYKNHLFGLFRNIGAGAPADTFTPPKAWTDLPKVMPEAWETMQVSKTDLTTTQSDAHLAAWNRIGPPKFLTEEEVVAAGAPVILAGRRSEFPPQPKAIREQIKTAKAAQAANQKAVGVDPFKAAAPGGIIG